MANTNQEKLISAVKDSIKAYMEAVPMDSEHFSWRDVNKLMQETFIEKLNQMNGFLYFLKEEEIEENLLLNVSPFTISSLKIGNREAKDSFKNLCSFFFKQKWEQIISTSRKREFVQPRHIISYWLTEKNVWSLTRIGIFMGNRDHSTIIHGNQTLAGLIETDKAIKSMCKNFAEFLSLYIQTENEYITADIQE